MFNFLMVATGLMLVNDENSPRQQAIATAVLGVGLARSLNELTED